MDYRDELDPKMVEVLRAKTPRERVEIANGMWRSARDMIDRVLRQDHPDWSDEQIQRAVAERMAHASV